MNSHNEIEQDHDGEPRRPATDAELVLADRLYTRHGPVESIMVDDNAEACPACGGTWVQAWVWVPA